MPKLIVANWKMHLTLSQSVTLAKGISKSEFRNPKLEIVLCPSFVALEEVAKIVRKARQVKLGAQDVEPEKRGAFTGEVGLDDLGELGVQYVLVGHSERRRMGESDALVNQKIRAVLNAGMHPILCVGESKRELRIKNEELRKAKKYVAKQLRAGLRGVTKKDLKRVIIAYEPVWAIGTGRADTPEDASAMQVYVRKVIGVKGVPVLYGGSVNSKNALEFAHAPGVDGLLI